MKLRNFILAAMAMVFAVSACQKEQTLDTTKLELSQKEMVFEAGAESKTMTVTAGRDWKAQFAEGVDWVSLTPASGSGAVEAQTITVTVTPNDSYERSTYVTFTTGLIKETLKIKQAGAIEIDYTDISEVRSLNPAVSGQSVTLGEEVFVKGVVVSNSSLDNFTSGKTCYIQDETGGLQIFFAANHNLEFGDIVSLDLSGATLKNYSMSAEIDGLPLAKATKLDTQEVTPKVVTIADYLENKYEGQYIEIDALVQVSESDLDKTWVVGGQHTNINIEDENGNSFIVRSGKFSSFGAETVAQGSGKIRGVSTIYNEDMQLVFAQTTDWAGLTGERFERKVELVSAEGQVVAVSEKTYLVKKSEGYAYVFVGEDGSHTLNVGDMVKVEGEADVYNGVDQIVNPTATVQSSGAFEQPTPTVLTAAEIDAYDATAGIFGYVTVTGFYAPSGKYHNLTFEGAARVGSLSYPVSIPAEYQNKNVDVTGYFVGISGSKYFNILVTDIKVSDVQPEAPEGVSCTKIDKIANLTAGSYYMSGFLESYKQNATTTYDFSQNPYHVWSSVIDDGDCETVLCSYNESKLAPKIGESATPTEILLSEVEGKENTYYVKIGEQYLSSSAESTNRKLVLGDEKTEWVASDHTTGGIVLTSETKGVSIGTAGAGSKLIRSYKLSSATSSLKYGLVFFQENK